MNPRRLALVLLIPLLSACAGPRLPFQHQEATLDPIQQAYDDLLQNYVDPPDSAALLSSAYGGVKQTLTDAGVQDSGVGDPSLAPNQSSNWDHFATAYNQVADKFGKTVGANKLEYAAITAMAGSLNDCQTHFYDPDALKQRQAELNGQRDFGGIGVLMKNIPGHPTVLRVLDGPAKSTDLRPGDEIVAVDGKPVAGRSFEDVRNSIRGPEGTTVKLTIKRPGSNQTMDFEISRAQIQAPIVDAAILGGSIGYLHFYSFPQGIAQQLDNALTVFQQRGVDSLIVDVRANTGGDQATILAVMARFIKTSSPVETQIERSGDQKSFGVDPNLYWKSPLPVTVLADDDTQSGGEMFAKAMQEEGGYRVIGVKTAGCASSAQMFQLGDGSGIEISTGKIVSGKGADINRAGVTPDQTVPYPVADLAAGQDPQLVAAINNSRGSAEASPSPATSGGQPRPAPSAAGAPGSSPLPVLKPITPQAPGANPILK